MLTKSERCNPGLALAVLTVLTSLTGVAQAQQNGLFPLAPVRRERVPCPAEEPIYKVYRSQYYGYFPPQWRQFPQGWHLNSPQKPNRQEELKKQPVLPLTPATPDTPDGDEGPAGGRRDIPKPPAENERSPFEIDQPDGAVKPNPGAAGARQPAAPAGPEPSPFDMPADEPPATGTPRTNRPATRGAEPPPTDPGTPNAPQAAHRDERPEPNDLDRTPMLAMPDATLPPVEEVGSPDLPAPGEPVLGGPGASAPIAMAAPSPIQAQPQPQPRRSRLSSLFDGLGLSRLRR